MTTVNNRLRNVQALTVNGVSAGGLTTLSINQGYDNMPASAPDGIGGPAIVDREVQYCRGNGAIQDWSHLVDLLTGTLGTLAVYSRKSGTAAATGYVLHTLTNPVIHRTRISQSIRDYMTCGFDFECKAADETKGFADMYVPTDSQSAPSYVSAARGGYRISDAYIDDTADVDIYHVTAFEFDLAMQIAKACNDADVGYTCVDAIADGMAAGGSITIQDESISGAQTKAQQLLSHAAKPLVLTVTQGSGATAKTVTIANCLFGNAREAMTNGPFFAVTLDFMVANDASTPLTLEGDNKIITIADAA